MDKGHESTVAFKKQLSEVKDEVDKTSSNYPDLSPEGKRECKEMVEKTLETLSKIKKSLEDADPDVKTLQLAGYQCGPMNPEDISRQIMANLKMRRTRNHDDKDEIVIEKISTEENFVHDESFKLRRINECFIRFNTAYSADYVLGLQIPFFSGRITLSKPNQTAATRATYRKIGNLVTRIKEIEDELNKLGAVRECNSRPNPPQHFVDRSAFVELLPKWKRAREAGTIFDHHTYAPLKHYKMVDRQSLQARMDTLYNEECDTLIQLREFQLGGVEFDF
jgi:hypothetical protein